MDSNGGYVSIAHKRSYYKIMSRFSNRWSPEIGALTCPITMKFDKQLGSCAAELLDKFYSDKIV